MQVAPFFQHLYWRIYPLPLLHAGWLESSFKLEVSMCPVLGKGGFHVWFWELGTQEWDVAMFIITSTLWTETSLLRPGVLPPQLCVCWLSETACKRGKRPLSLTESPVGEGAGGFNLDSVPHKGKKEQKILNREWSSTRTSILSKDLC